MEQETIEEKVLNVMNKAFNEHSHFRIEKSSEISMFNPGKISPEEFYQRKRDVQLNKPLAEVLERDVIISKYKGKQQKEYVTHKSGKTNLVEACIDTLAKEKNKLDDEVITLKTYFIVRGGKRIICDTLLSIHKDDFGYRNIYRELMKYGAI